MEAAHVECAGTFVAAIREHIHSFAFRQIMVLPNDTLVDIFEAASKGSGIQHSPNQFFEGVMRSTDGGLTWSQPIKIANEDDVGVADCWPSTCSPGASWPRYSTANGL